MKNNNKTYGCELIQKMKQDIDKLKKDTFTIPCLVKIVLSLAGIIIFAFVVRTFIPSRSPETINYNIIVNKANENCKSEIKTEMAEALVKVEERAVNAYNDKFATLLTILTIFGIAWPVIIGFAQYKISEHELNKIDNADKSAKQSASRAEQAIKLAKEANQKLDEAAKIATDANDRAEQINDILKKTQWESYSSLSDLYSYFARHIDEDSNMSKNEFEDYCLFRAMYFHLKSAEYDKHLFQPAMILALKNLLSKEESTLRSCGWNLCMHQAEKLLHEHNIKEVEMIIEWLNEIKPEIKRAEN